MYAFRGTIVANHKYDTPPEEYGVLVLEVRHENTGEIQFVEIFQEYLIDEAYELDTGDEVEIVLEQDQWEHEEVMSIRKLSTKLDMSFYQDVDLPGEIYDENDRYM